MITSNLTDKELYEQSETYSKLIRKYRNKFIALLPEINRRELYYKYKMTSIYQFAAIKAGLSHDTVRKILKLKEDIKELPKLNDKFESGDVGWSKIETISRIATPENEKILVEKLDTMTHATLKVLVKAIKIDNHNKEQNNLFQQDGVNVGNTDLIADESHPDSRETFTFKLNPETMARFRVLKFKISKQVGREITWQEAIEEIVEHYDEQPERLKQIPRKFNKRAPLSSARPVETTLRLVTERNIPNTTTIHHQTPFALTQDQNETEPLCKQTHHEVNHEAGIIQQLQLEEQNPINEINQKYQRLKMRF